jgi:hypothetical protein
MVISAVALASAGFLLTPASGRAAGVDADTFHFVGSTSFVSPPVEPITTCANPGAFSGCGSGSYGFSSTTCAETSTDPADPNDGGPLQDVDSPVGCSINSSGTFTNGTCGTGVATGTATITEGADVAPTSKLPSDTYNVTYTITFINGSGVLTGTATEQGSGETASVTGAVQIVPTTGNCVTTGVSAFDVVGSITTTA